MGRWTTRTSLVGCDVLKKWQLDIFDPGLCSAPLNAPSKALEPGQESFYAQATRRICQQCVHTKGVIGYQKDRGLHMCLSLDSTAALASSLRARQRRCSSSVAPTTPASSVKPATAASSILDPSPSPCCSAWPHSSPLVSISGRPCFFQTTWLFPAGGCMQASSLHRVFLCTPLSCSTSCWFDHRPGWPRFSPFSDLSKLQT